MCIVCVLVYGVCVCVYLGPFKTVWHVQILPDHSANFRLAVVVRSVNPDPSWEEEDPGRAEHVYPSHTSRGDGVGSLPISLIHLAEA